jgi:hypothetical protein
MVYKISPFSTACYSPDGIATIKKNLNQELVWRHVLSAAVRRSPPYWTLLRTTIEAPTRTLKPARRRRIASIHYARSLRKISGPMK